MAKMTKAEKALDAKLNSLCSLATFDNPINIMRMSKLFAAAKAAVAAGKSDEDVLAELRALIPVLNGGK